MWQRVDRASHMVEGAKAPRHQVRDKKPNLPRHASAGYMGPAHKDSHSRLFNLHLKRVVRDISQDALSKPSRSPDRRSGFQTIRQIIQVAEVCQDTLKNGELSPREEKEMLVTMVDAYKTILMGLPVVEPLQLVTALHRCAAMVKITGEGRWILSKRRSFFIDVLKQLQREIDDLDARMLSTMVWSLGQFGPEVTEEALGGGLTVLDLIDQVKMVCERKLSAFNPKDVSCLMVGLAYLDNRDFGRFMSTLCSEISLKMSSYGPRELANVAWAIGKMQIKAGRSVIKKMELRLRSPLSDFSPQGICNLIWGAARVRAMLSNDSMAAVAAHVVRNRAKLAPQDVGNFMWAFAKLRFFPGMVFLEQLAPVVSKRIRYFQPQEIANVLYACAIFGEAPSEIVNATRTYILDFRDRFSLQELINCGWSLAILGELDGWVYDALTERLISENGGDFASSTGVGVHIPPQIQDSDLRQFYQCLLHLRYLFPEELVETPIGLERAARRSWISLNVMSPINYLVPRVVQTLSSLGYACETPKFVVPGGITVNEVRISSTRVGLEVVGRSNCFENDCMRLQGPFYWRHRLMEALGWEPVIIYEDVWTEMDKRGQREFLEDNILVLGDMDFE
ncbi:hypothetical protein BSKO_06557 [Bryopsis sp. KO-2023]|nr:hypothetical protein BSKO_06557 [Bryopsis sp. KO-2023]